MRENMGLFRGKRICTDEWAKGSLHIEWGETISDGHREKDYRILGMRGECYYVDRETVGECTGLKDENGKLIFEGDIVQYYGTYPLEVFIENGHAKIRWIDTVENVECVEMFLGYDEETCRECEIIGNIHDNPELLKEGTDND